MKATSNFMQRSNTFTPRDGTSVYYKDWGRERRRSSFRTVGHCQRMPGTAKCLPALFMHGDADQIVVPGSTLKFYPGAPHGTCTSISDTIDTDLLAFIANTNA